MAPYGASGYVMFRGGDILCDGRQDPFITEHSVGALGWNAFQRSMYGYGEYLPEIVEGRSAGLRHRPQQCVGQAAAGMVGIVRDSQSMKVRLATYLRFRIIAIFYVIGLLAEIQ